MASSPSPSPMAYLFLLFLSYLPITTLSQNPGTSPNSPSIAECGSHLLPLVPCAPFVQGSVPMPAQQCCDNLKQVYTQQPTCLCFVLNNTNLSSFPINTTLALQLPQICNLKVDFTTCLGGPPPSTQPASQVSFGARNGSTVGASPVVTVAPRPTIMGHGIQRNNGGSLKTADHLMVVVVAALLSIALF